MISKWKEASVNRPPLERHTFSIHMSPLLPITQVPAPLTSDYPDWFRTRRQNAWEQYLSLPTPLRNREEWRFGDVKQLNFDTLPLAEIQPALVDMETPEEGDAFLFFSNGHFLSSATALPEGVTVMPLSAALKEVPELVEKYFMREETRLGSEKYAALHAAHVTEGVFIHVAEGIQLEKAIQIIHILGGSPGILFPHTLIVCEKDASVTVMEEFSSELEEANVVLSVNDLVAGPGSRLKYALFQNLNKQSRFLQINSTRVEEEGEATGLIVNTGATWAREESTSILAAKGARSIMLSASVANGEQQYDQRTSQRHVAGHAFSDLLYKNTLLDRSKTTFAGMITVDRGSHFTDAFQTCRNLILSEDAEANSLPGLEINADQVKCSHGTTNATISDDEIFYLLSRGITPEHARELIAKGFSIEVLERFHNAEVEERALELLSDKFEELQP